MSEALNSRVCWVGGTRYTNPLNATHDKKWRTLRERLGGELFVISFAAGPRPRYFAPHARFYLLPALPLALLRYITMYTLALPLLLWLIYRHGVQVVVAHDPYFGLIGALARGMVGRGRLVLIVESHADFEVAVFMQRRVPLAGALRRVMAAVARYTLRRADVLRAVSGNTRDQLAAWSPPGLPLHQFITWTDMDAFTQAERETTPSQTHDLLYAGVLVPRKGVHYLLQAFANLADESPQSHLWLAGTPDNPEYAAQLARQVESAGLQARVTFTGGLSQTELAAYMRRCRALVLPSSSEGLPRVVVEALLAGTPVVATCVAGIPEVVYDGENGYLIPPEDPAALETALRRILFTADVDRMGQAARELAQRDFSVEVYMAGYRRLLADAAALVAQDKSR